MQPLNHLSTSAQKFSEYPAQFVSDYSVLNAGEIDSLLNDLRLKEIASQLKGTEQEAKQLAQEINKNWWATNRKRFIQ